MLTLMVPWVYKDLESQNYLPQEFGMRRYIMLDADEIWF